MLMPRRSFLTGLGSLITAPAIVRASNLMPVKALKITPDELIELYIQSMFKRMPRITDYALGDVVEFGVMYGKIDFKIHKVTEIYNVDKV